MPLHAFLLLTHETLGVIKGAARQESRRGEIPVIGFEHLVRSEREPETLLAKGGTPAAGRVHGVFTVTKELDQSTPKLRQAMAKAEPFSRWMLRCFRVPPAGGGPAGIREENHWTVELTNARVAATRMFMPNARLAAYSAYNEYEEVDFTYEKIKVSWRALTGNGAATSEGSHESAASFVNSDHLAALESVAQNLGKDLGKAVALEVSAALKAAAADLLKSK